MEIKVGSKLRSNDPRFAGLTVEVSGVSDTHASYKSKTRTAKVKLDRIITDPQGNLPRGLSSWHQGWTLVDPNAIDVA